MTTMLICNVGRRDVQIAPNHLPDDLHDPEQQRARAAYLREQFEQLYQHIDLAIIRKVVEYIGAAAIDQIVLFGSDQSDPHYQHTDTLDMASVVRDVLCRRWQFRPEQVRVVALTADPSNQNRVMSFYEQMLPTLDAGVQPTQIFLEVTGGTPAMSNALQLAGTEIFQDRAVALYVSRTSEMPNRLAIGKRLLGGPLRKVLVAHLQQFQYAAALETWALYRPYFIDMASAGVAQMIEGVLRHAVARINLDVPAARETLRGLDGVADGQYQPLIAQLYDHITPLSREKALAEVLQIAQVRLDTHAWADFLAQMVRFVENALRVLCLRHGAQFINWQNQIDDSGAWVDADWARRQDINPREIGMGQSGLQKLLRRLAPDDPTATTVLTATERLTDLIRLRNDLTHSLAGVSAQTLSAAFGAPHTGILPLLESMYTQIAGQPLADNPYNTLNAALIRLLES